MAHSGKGWVGIDLDGTLAHYDGWKGPGHIGEPIPSMLAFCKELIARGQEIKIFTARACVAEQVEPIRDWLRAHGVVTAAGEPIEVTNIKDFRMVQLFDDRCVQVKPNAGTRIDGSAL